MKERWLSTLSRLHLYFLYFCLKDSSIFSSGSSKMSSSSDMCTRFSWLFCAGSSGVSGIVIGSGGKFGLADGIVLGVV